MHHATVLALLATVSAVNGYDLKQYPKLQAIYNKYNAKGSVCKTLLKDGFYDDGQTKDGKYYRYCGDLGEKTAIFLHRNGGGLNDMDIDCDGSNPCPDDPSFKGTTSFQAAWTTGFPGVGVQELSKATTQGYISDLDANVHPYVVFGNEGSTPSFNPLNFGMAPLSVMAVVCNGQVWYGVWGDENGGTSTGEASLALGRLCFPDEGLGGNNGHDASDVLYIGFRNNTAYPGHNGKYKAIWNTKNTMEFETSIKGLGDSLVASLPQV